MIPVNFNFFIRLIGFFLLGHFSSHNLIAMNQPEQPSDLYSEIQKINLVCDALNQCVADARYGEDRNCLMQRIRDDKDQGKICSDALKLLQRMNLVSFTHNIQTARDLLRVRLTHLIESFGETGRLRFYSTFEAVNVSPSYFTDRNAWKDALQRGHPRFFDESGRVSTTYQLLDLF